MAINRTRFLVVFVVANLLFVGLIGVIMASDVALGVPMAGVGGFTVTFDELRGEGLQQNPTIGEVEDCPAFPAAQTQMERAEADNLQLYRDFNLPDRAPGDADTFRLVISADSAEYTGLTQEFTSLQSDELIFPQGQQVQHQPSGPVEEQFQITGEEVIIRGGVVHAQAQFTESISLSGSSVSLETDPDEFHDVDETECPGMDEIDDKDDE